ncbi:hypothetical protein N7492_005880 [Penicillium capsulatum]|uniref:SIS domain-containing protein n=1 Tax=Penicillium capsulatum TaxID=69766 RepID=A0A9W9IE62_9EURO|nr:hypothetical protein N7492_005880 [Penicillium capsulatum]KAJ6135018.1 hypothetical protein N7512_000178 [Penicillium capsulatum]
MSSHALAQTPSPRWPLTPPDPSESQLPSAAHLSGVATALEVMATERAALEYLERLYQTDARLQLELLRAVNQIVRTVVEGGKLVVCGVGKSGKIGRKIEATMNSLGVYSAFLHPTEALHGDLGLVRPNDTMLLISFSGRSPELLSLVPHIPPTAPVIALTSHTKRAECPLLNSRPRVEMDILLSAPIHEPEETSLGVGAPTSSTTVALCLGDALAIAVTRILHKAPGCSPADVFRSFHPGGAIGAGVSGQIPSTRPFIAAPTTVFDSPSSSGSSMWEELADAPSIPPFTLQPPPEQRGIPIDTLVPFGEIANFHCGSLAELEQIRLVDVLALSYKKPKSRSWILLGHTAIVTPRGFSNLLFIGTSYDMSLTEALKTAYPGKETTPAVVSREKWFSVLPTTPITEVRQMVARSQRTRDPITVIAMVKIPGDYASCIGVIQAEDIMP